MTSSIKRACFSTLLRVLAWRSFWLQSVMLSMQEKVWSISGMVQNVNTEDEALHAQEGRTISRPVCIIACRKKWYRSNELENKDIEHDSIWRHTTLLTPGKLIDNLNMIVWSLVLWQLTSWSTTSKCTPVHLTLTTSSSWRHEVMSYDVLFWGRMWLFSCLQIHQSVLSHHTIMSYFLIFLVLTVWINWDIICFVRDLRCLPDVLLEYLLAPSHTVAKAHHIRVQHLYNMHIYTHKLWVEHAGRADPHGQGC